MGCIVSCFGGRDRERNLCSRPLALSDSNPYYDLENLEERLVDNQLGSLFINEEENCDPPHALDEELRLEANQLKLCGVVLETPQEIRKSNNRVAFRELNGTNQSPESARTASNKKIQLFTQCEETPKVFVPALSEWLKPTTAFRGIPNTTTKYKEDQQVRWYKIPFQERLDKALS